MNEPQPKRVVTDNGKHQSPRHLLTGLLLTICLFSTLSGQHDPNARPTHSGGPLSPEQGSYDVRAYELDLNIDPDQRSIAGTLTVEADVLQPLEWLVLDLDSALEVSSAQSVQEQMSPLAFERRDAQIWIRFPEPRKPGQTVQVQVSYHGTPRPAPRPPWIGGFVWRTDSSGNPWIGVACQLDGADLWWPCKDHPSDKPDRMDLRITVPSPLVVAANGELQRMTDYGSKRVYYWKIKHPINTYNVTVNAAHYRLIEGQYQSVSGDQVPLMFWVLPENYDKGLKLFSQVPSHLKFLEERLGPYPFRGEKYGVAETAYLGMEHQTIIAYGSNYRDNTFGFDWLHFHELAHEWWGNLVTVSDWKDYWIHEGFASYLEAMYAEFLQGEEALHRYMKPLQRRLRNQDPVAPEESRTTVEKYFVGPEYVHTDGDVNFKGAWILHTLRYLVGDEVFMRSMRQFLYPRPELENSTDISRFRFVNTQEYFDLVEEISGKELDWFVDLYLRQPELPRLQKEHRDGVLSLTWKTPQDLPFPMPVRVKIGGEVQTVVFTNNRAQVRAASEEIEVDPQNWILKED